MTQPTQSTQSTESSDIAIRFAQPGDTPLILHFIRSLAVYEKLEHEVVADEASIRAHLFGPRPAAEVVLGELSGAPVGFALYFTSFSTFLARPGIYLEDLFVEPPARGKGVGLALMSALAQIAVERNYGRFEWAVLDWNTPSIEFYRALGALPQSEWTVQRVVGAPLAQLAKRWPGKVAK
jgi:GNAT superfamily N-acetyltransferase